LGGWKQAYRAVREGNAPSGSAPLPPPWDEVIHASWSAERVLPWEHLEGPLPKTTLLKHQQEALGGGGTNGGLQAESSLQY
jgi:hypothetical protein